MQVLSLIGAFGGSLVAFVMPSFAYTALFRGELPPAKRFLATIPGWCSILSTIFLIVNTTIVRCKRGFLGFRHEALTGKGFSVRAGGPGHRAGAGGWRGHFLCAGLNKTPLSIY